MTNAPRLTEAEIVERLEALYGASDHRPMLALFGEGEESVVDVRGAGRFRIVPTANELQLRSALPLVEDADHRIVFLVPWAHELPLDIRGRFSKSRVLPVGRTLRLQRMFEAANIEDAALADPLAQYVLQWGLPSKPLPLAGGRLTLESLWNGWLSAAWGVDTDGGVSLGALLGWAAADQRGETFCKELEARSGAAVRTALYAHLERKVGPTGSLVWAAWEQGRGRALMELATLFEALARTEDSAVAMWIKLTLKETLGIDLGGQLRQHVKELGDAVAAAFQWIEKRDGSAPVVRTILDGADARINDDAIRAAIIHSSRLPSSWRARLDAVGLAVGAAAAKPSAPAVATAAKALHELEVHQAFKDPERFSLFKRAEMGVRLAAWLAARPDQKLAKGMTPYADVERLARWYVEDGGYVDWARRRARGNAEGAFGTGIQAIVAAADAARTELDLAFARGLPEWVRAGRPAEQVLPLDQAVTRLAGKFLQEKDSRRVLVILFDGMAWAQAVELLESMGSAGNPWGPLAWHREKAGQVGNGFYPATIAGLPTVTEVSRAGFFAGQPTPPGPRLDTGKDPERWANHKTARALIDKQSVPKLFLRAESHNADGSASKEALSLVRDTDQRIVALVINAIDASLKSDSQQHHEWTVDSIKSLRDLLDAAHEAGRAILMASDHGHVPADRLAPCGHANPDGGARWRPWKVATDPVADYEVAFATEKDGDVWAPKGAHGVILLADDAHRYGGGAHAGEHGGATLAEVMAPTLLIGVDSAPLAEDDPSMATQAAHKPSWWHFDVAEVRKLVSVPPPSNKKKKNEAQLELTPTPPSVAALEHSAIFVARATNPKQRALALQMVDYLLSHDGVAPIAALASALNIQAWRMTSVAVPLTEILNADGYQVLRIDFTAKEVRLDVATLEQLFEVKL